MDHSARAAELFCKGYNCAQAVTVAFCDVTGLSEAFSARLASSFGGGMGRMREVCGAVSGMFMVAGLLYGDGAVPSHEAKTAHYARVRSWLPVSGKKTAPFSAGSCCRGCRRTRLPCRSTARRNTIKCAPAPTWSGTPPS